MVRKKAYVKKVVGSIPACAETIYCTIHLDQILDKNLLVKCAVILQIGGWILMNGFQLKNPAPWLRMKFQPTETNLPTKKNNSKIVCFLTKSKSEF